MKYLIMVLAALCLVATTPTAVVVPKAFVPIVANKAIVPEIIPVADILMPFNVLNGVEPISVQAANGDWYISVYRIDTATGSWVVRWRQGESIATPIGLVTPATEALSTADIPLTSARGALATNYAHNALYFFGWQDDPNAPRRPILKVFQVVGY